MKNKLRTPSSTPKQTDRDIRLPTGSSKFNTVQTDTIDTDERCKIHLAECYTANKKIDKLTEELEDRTRAENEARLKLIDLERELKVKASDSLGETIDRSRYIEELKEQIRVISTARDEKDIIEYYERRLEEEFNSKIGLIKSFTRSIEKVLPDGTYAAKDDVWRSLLKKYENEILSLEGIIAEYKKTERKVFMRQRFFDKYSNQTEERFEKFSKISKEYYNQEKKIENYKQEIKKLLSENATLKEDLDSLSKQNIKIKDNYCKTMSFVNTVKPILKLGWEDIKQQNEQNYEKIIKLYKSDEEFAGKNIIQLTDNLSKFFSELEGSIGIDLKSMILIVSDLKEYILMLLKKNQYLMVNQYSIIGICLNMNQKIVEFTKSTGRRIDQEYLNMINEIKNFCSILLIEYNPK
jgi:chromosome segregation ATPase